MKTLLINTLAVTALALSMTACGSMSGLSASLITLLVFVPAVLLTDIWLATALTFGLLTGYLAYAVTHHAIHHWHGNSAWLKQRKHCHALHHNPHHPAAHYGVTSSLCDSLSGTAD